MRKGLTIRRYSVNWNLVSGCSPIQVKPDSQTFGLTAEHFILSRRHQFRDTSAKIEGFWRFCIGLVFWITSIGAQKCQQ